MSKTIAVLSKAKYILDYASFNTLYYSLIFPHFSYYVEAWGNTYMSNTKLLYSITEESNKSINKGGAEEHTKRLLVLRNTASKKGYYLKIDKSHL